MKADIHDEPITEGLRAASSPATNITGGAAKLDDVSEQGAHGQRLAAGANGPSPAVISDLGTDKRRRVNSYQSLRPISLALALATSALASAHGMVDSRQTGRSSQGVILLLTQLRLQHSKV